jgi:hypothetical protein
MAITKSNEIRTEDFAAWREEIRTLAEIAGFGRRWLSSLAIFHFTDGVIVMQPQDFDFGRGDGGKRKITADLAEKLEAQLARIKAAHPEGKGGAYYSFASENAWGSRKAKKYTF